MEPKTEGGDTTSEFRRVLAVDLSTHSPVNSHRTSETQNKFSLLCYHSASAHVVLYQGSIS